MDATAPALWGHGKVPLAMVRWSTEVEAVGNHIRVRRIWEYVSLRVELSLEEQTHLFSCGVCLAAFRICLLSDRHPLDHDEHSKSA